MKALNLAGVYKNYKGKWVALAGQDNTEVVASGTKLKEVLEEAQKRGIKRPLITQIPREVLPIVGGI